MKAEIQNKVTEIVARVAREKSLPAVELSAGTRIIQDVGLKSLDMARIIALLEADYPYDPFSELVSITSIRTIADLAGAYALAAKQQGG